MNRPNLFLVGAMKSGSTSLTHYLNNHPEIYMSMKPKEPSYFIDRETLSQVYPAMEKLGIWQSEQHYLDLFSGAGKEKYLGEASQNYARLPLIPGIAEKISEFTPDAKIIYIVRNPVERTISHYWYMVANFGERRDMLTAIKESDDYTLTSYYAMQLQPYIELFGLERIKVVVSEELKAEPEKTMADIFNWLGVDSQFVPDNLDTDRNTTPKVLKQASGSGLLYKLRHSKLWELIGPLVPKQVRTLGKSMSEKDVDRSKVNVEEVRAYLKPLQQPQIEEFSQLINKDLSSWL